MDVNLTEKTVKTEFGNIVIRRAESVTIKFLDGTLAVLTQLDDGDERSTFFSTALTDEPTDAADFVARLTHDIESKDDPEMWEAAPKDWTILRESMRVLIGDESYGKESEIVKNSCASCGNCRPSADDVTE